VIVFRLGPVINVVVFPHLFLIVFINMKEFLIFCLVEFSHIPVPKME